MSDLNLFCIKHNNSMWTPEKGSPYFQNKQDAKKVRDALNKDTKTNPFHVSRGPDHWRSK